MRTQNNFNFPLPHMFNAMISESGEVDTISSEDSVIWSVRSNPKKLRQATRITVMPTIATIRPVTSGGNNTLNRLTLLEKPASETRGVKVTPYKRDNPPILEATMAAAKFVGEQTGGHRYPAPIGPFGRAMITDPIPP